MLKLPPEVCERVHTNCWIEEAYRETQLRVNTGNLVLLCTLPGHTNFLASAEDEFL